MSTPTPRTDACLGDLSELSRNLETELTAALARVAALEKERDETDNQLCDARDGWRAAESRIDSLTRQLSESQAQLAKCAENVSREEANELRDVLRTLVPSGRAFITSARELVQRWEEQKTEIQTLQAQLTSAREDKEKLKKEITAVAEKVQKWRWGSDGDCGVSNLIYSLEDFSDNLTGRTETPAGGETGKASTWLPIEQAPKDNKRLLYLAKLDDKGNILALDWDGIWQSESESWEIPEVYYYWASANGIEDPTHFAFQNEPIPPVKADAWQDISTAPKDGTLILVSDGVYVHEAKWSGAQWCVADSWKNWWLNVKFWCALPPPPQGKETK